jgi:hypothetical protein
MLNIGKLAHGGAEYYLTTVATSVEAYYTGAGEAPGRWLGTASTRLGGVPWVRWSLVVGFSCCGGAGLSSFELDGGEHAER